MTSALGAAFLETMPEPPTPDAMYRARAAAVIPSGASTGSKRTAALYGSADRDDLPTHYTAARGCRITTAGGRELIDCTMALGAVALGYADESVNAAVIDAIGRGNVAGLSSTLEVDVAERLCEVIPCAERVRFLKTGAEGVAAAVRIARAYTGRDAVLTSGYFGWLDWWSGAAGVPARAHADAESLPFDDIGALDDASRRHGGALAAIIIEPVVHEQASREWLTAARQACDALGAVLIFDEVKSGFRVRTGGVQEAAGITPDVAVFGKALANGFPLSAVVGRAGVMGAADETWISSTLAGETAALAAASAVLDRHHREDVCGALERIGASTCRELRRAIAESGVTGVEILGLAPMWLMRFDDDADRVAFQRAMLDEGVLVKNGAYNFAALAHDDLTVREIGRAARAALGAMR
ncbi:MAG: aminotransferase class III-fold pyridoxal phosphate-dependent enzyme [Gemmatimonadaceae bacterium]